MISTAPRSYRWELFLNQAWQGANFASKALSLALLSPWMIRTWGPVGFALFALANSVLVSMAGLDSGIRGATRLRLCDALQRGDRADGDLAIWEGAAAFAVVALPVAAAGWAAAALGGWSRWLHLPPEGDFLLGLTVTLVCLFLFTILLLERLIAQNRLSTLKAANTAGAVAALPVLAAVLWLKASPTVAVTLYFLCLLVPNGILLLREGTFHAGFWPQARRLRWGNVVETFRTGKWFYATTIASVAKSHALTFLVAALGGAAMAGTFYLLLRITEVVGTLGVASADTALAALAGEPSPRRRGANFRHTYAYALIFCLHGALGIAFLTPLVLPLWLPADALRGLSPAIGWFIAAYGLATAFSKLVVCSAIPVGIFRRTTAGNLAEAAVTLGLGWLLLPRFGLPGLFLASVPAALMIVPAARALAQNFSQTARETWLAPWRPLRGPLAASAAVLAAAAWYGHLLPAAGAAVCVGLSTALALRRLHREEEPAGETP